MIRLGKTFSASVQAPAAIVWVCAACKQGVNDNDGGGGATTQRSKNYLKSHMNSYPLMISQFIFSLDLMKRLESFGEEDWISFQSPKPYKIEKYHVVP